MSPISRRQVLGAAAASAAAVAVPAGLPGAAQAALTGTIADVQHVVILMQENRSFDHYFGTLRGVRGFADRSAIQLSGGYPVFNQPNVGARQYPWQMSLTPSAAGQTPEVLAQCDGSLDHGWSSQHSAWNNGKMDNWVLAKLNVRTLGFMNRTDNPFYYGLADAYTVCDAYHCSILSATGPNRTYLWSGSIDPAGTHGGPANDGGDESGLTYQTYAESLQNAGVSWKVYQNANDNYGDNGLAYFTQFVDAPAGTPLHDRGMASVPAVTGSTDGDIIAALRSDVVAGTLPRVSWIVTNQAFSEHPDAPPGDGANFVSRVLAALAANPAVLDSTVFLLTYDENDGFFDHVPPPVPASGTADEFVSGKPIGLGFRVPMLVVSPWSRGGWVNSQVFDHTSVIRFLERWTAALGTPATCPNISAWRRAVCGDLTTAFDFTSPVYGLPALPAAPSIIGKSHCDPLPNPKPATNALPAQESGTRPARALPYQPNAYVDHLEFGSAGKILVWLRMDNLGTAGTHFAAYANAYRTGGPWQYTVSPGGSTSDFFNVGSGYGSGKYDLTIIGPNRFLRRFTGDASTGGKNTEVRSSSATAPNTGKTALWLTMANTGSAAATFTVTSNNYRSDGPWTYAVPAGGTVADYFNAVAYTNGWYDFTVTCSADASWSRRFTGHIETGSPSVSG
ncbi:phosphocholine-specific phospholipase C [Hamadaea tsunoensis]|uniref:phosphocholine-specific phospholipase C n=1 Tax=Hamadaea tsunoensis TaxID=53368 RepID=UPI000411289E|nr:phospholipase C, phosphocholine-specific [Hamadaea tsunoensis]